MTFAKSRTIRAGSRIYLRSDLDARVRITLGKARLDDQRGALDFVLPAAPAPNNSTLLYVFGSSGRQAMADEVSCTDCGDGGGGAQPSEDGCPQTSGAAVGPIIAYNVDPMGRNIGTAISNNFASAHVSYQIVLFRSSGFGQSIFGSFDTTSSDLSFDVSTVGYDAFVGTYISLTITNNTPPPPDILPPPQDSRTGTTSTTCA